jgi:hypothetical protein
MKGELSLHETIDAFRYGQRWHPCFRDCLCQGFSMGKELDPDVALHSWRMTG